MLRMLLADAPSSAPSRMHPRSSEQETGSWRRCHLFHQTLFTRHVPRWHFLTTLCCFPSCLFEPHIGSNTFGSRRAQKTSPTRINPHCHLLDSWNLQGRPSANGSDPTEAIVSTRHKFTISSGFHADDGPMYAVHVSLHSMIPEFAVAHRAHARSTLPANSDRISVPPAAWWRCLHTDVAALQRRGSQRTRMFWRRSTVKPNTQRLLLCRSLVWSRALPLLLLPCTCPYRRWTLTTLFGFTEAFAHCVDAQL